MTRMTVNDQQPVHYRRVERRYDRRQYRRDQRAVGSVRVAQRPAL